MMPPLVFLTVFGYWRFLGSGAFRVLMERILERALRADVTIGSHEVESLAFRRIRLSDLSVEFMAGGEPSGVRFKAKEATASAPVLLGIGPLEEVVIRDAEARLDGPASTVARLDFLTRPKRASSVGRIRLEAMAVSFTAGERTYRVGGMDWTFDFSGRGLRLSAEVGRLRIEGLRSKGLEEEAPSVRFDIEVDGTKVVVRKLSVRGASGWQAGGEMEVDLGPEPPLVRGRVDLWDLPVSIIYTPPLGVEISPRAHVEQRIEFRGPLDRVRFEVTTDVKGLTYRDGRLGLAASGVTLKSLRKVKYYDVMQLLRGMLREKGTAPTEAGDVQRNLSNGRRPG